MGAPQGQGRDRYAVGSVSSLYLDLRLVKPTNGVARAICASDGTGFFDPKAKRQMRAIFGELSCEASIAAALHQHAFGELRRRVSALDFAQDRHGRYEFGTGALLSLVLAPNGNVVVGVHVGGG